MKRGKRMSKQQKIEMVIEMTPMHKTDETLLITQEECAEVIQAISKVFRFGIDGVYADRTNKERLEEELGDLLCMVDLLVEFGIVNDGSINAARHKKRDKLSKYSSIFLPKYDNHA
jgi:NTP pyrophosphatase (non-canonical NTP hydrolase)